MIIKATPHSCSHYKIFGGQLLPPNFQICPKTDRFFWFCAKRSAEMSPYLSPSEEFSEIPTYKLSSAPGLEVWPAKLHLILISAMPHSFDWKHCQNGQKWHFFVFLVGALWILKWGVVSFEIVAQTQNYKRTWTFFWEIAQWAKYCGPLYRRLESDLLKVWILGSPPFIIRRPKKLRCFFGCKIQSRS